jgi:hypothetical protein
LGGRVIFAAGAKRRSLVGNSNRRHFQSTPVKSTLQEIL